MRTRQEAALAARVLAVRGTQGKGRYVLRAFVWVVMLAIFASLPGGCSSYSAPPDDAQVNAALRNVLNEYETRALLARDLIVLAQPLGNPNSAPVSAATAAQADLACIRLDPEALAEQVPFERFAVAQRQVDDAISRLLIELGNDGQIGQNPRFETLRAQLGAVERRIAVAREAYDEVVDRYNASLDVSRPKARTHMPEPRPRPTFRVIAGAENRQV
jgi:LemA protein